MTKFEPEIDQFISDVLTAYGEAEDSVDSVLQTSGTEWIVAFTDETRVRLRAESHSLRLVFDLSVDLPASRITPELMTGMLVSNLIPDRAVPVHAGLVQADGPMVLKTDIPLQMVTTEGMLTALSALRVTASGWKTIAEAGPTPSAPVAEETMIRL